MALVTTVLMATGKVGRSTIETLKEKFNEKVKIRGASRNPDTVAEDFKNLDGVEFVKAAVGGDKDDMKNALDGADSLFLILPDTIEDPVEDVIQTVQAAKESGVKHLLLQSAVFADIKPEECTCVISKQYHQVEKKIKEIFPDVIVLRLSFFCENNYPTAFSIRKESKMYGPGLPDAPSPYMAASDAGKAAAAILSSPEDHKGKTYSLINDSVSASEFSKCVGEAIGKEVSYEQQTYEQWTEKIEGFGVPKWQVQNYVELFRMTDNKDKCMILPVSEDFEKLTGAKPTTVREWCILKADNFK